MAGFRAPFSGDVMTPQSFVADSLGREFGTGEALYEAAAQQITDSFGLGTVLRDVQLNGEGRQYIEEGEAGGRREGFTISRRETDEEVIARGDQPLTEEEYKNSEWFRPGVKYDTGMTVNRAQAIAEYNDVREFREAFLDKSPITGFIGGLAGAALDPINYVPIVGPGVRGAAALRTSAAVGRGVVAGSADAALNTAIFGLATADTRAGFGDDISVEALASDIAIGALIGGVVGGVATGIGRLRTRNDVHTLVNDRKARDTLSDAVGAHIQNDEIQLSKTSVAAVDEILTKKVTARAQTVRDADTTETRVDGLTAVREVTLVDRLDEIETDLVYYEAQADNVAFDALRDIQRLDAENQVEVVDRQIEAREQLAEPSPTRDAEVEQLRDQRASIVERNAEPSAAIRSEFDDVFDGLHDGVTRTIRDLKQERNRATQRLRSRRKQSAAELQQTRDDFGGDETAAYNSLLDGTVASLKQTSRNVQAPPRQGVETDVKDVTLQDIATDNNIDFNSGDFVERADVEASIEDGSAPAGSQRILDDADQDYNTAVSYGDALKSAAACIAGAIV